MTEEKIKISFPQIEDEEFKFNGIKVSVQPYLDINDKVTLINDYIENLYSDITSDFAQRYLVSEYALKIQILDRLTNIDVEDINFDLLLLGGLWKEVKSKIKNYEEFRFQLDEVLSLRYEEKKLEYSVGYVLENLSKKLMDLLDKISSMDVEQLKKSSEQFVQELDKLNQNIPGIVGKPASRGKKSKVQ